MAPLFAAAMDPDLHLNAGDLGDMVGILGVCWGVLGVPVRVVSDRLGRRKAFIPAIVVFSCLSVLTGVASSLIALLTIRGIMGISEGPVTSIGVAAAVEASHSKRRGMNNGMFQCVFALFGLALARAGQFGSLPHAICTDRPEFTGKALDQWACERGVWHCG